MMTKNKILYKLRKYPFKSPCRAAYASAKLPVSLDEIDKVFGSFVAFYKEMTEYKLSGSVTNATKS